MQYRRPLPAIALVCLLAGCDDPTGAGPAASVLAVGAGPAAAVVGTELASPLVVKVADAAGAGVRGIPVTWTATGGTVTPLAPVTDDEGLASARWTLPAQAGSYEVRASVEGLAPATFQATATPDAPAAVRFGEDSLRAVLPGDTVRLQSRVADRFGNPIEKPALVWSSSDPRIAAVDQSGLVTGVGEGTAQIRARAGEAEGLARVVVRSLSTPVKGPSLATGSAHTCGLGATGGALCWGLNGAGQLGNVSTISADTPVAVVGSQRFVTLSAGGEHTCALDRAGTAYCWGSNGDGQLGDGTLTSRSAPARVAAGTAFVRISAGGAHTCALDAEGRAYCWGRDITRQGANTIPSPQPVSGDFRFTEIASGTYHVCALTAAGAPYCWGNAQQATPVAVESSVAFRELSAGAALTCGVATTGGAYCWDFLGAGLLSVSSSKPVGPIGGTNAAAVTVGVSVACITAESGEAYCWGSNDRGQIGEGDGDFRKHDRPGLVTGGGRYAAIAAGGRHVCALDTAGAARCWGDRGYGQIGDGRRAFQAEPRPVAGGHAFRSLDAGSTHTCGVTTAGAAYCWGYNSNGRLGTGDFGSTHTPAAVTGGRAFTSISAGDIHTCALASDARGYCWGGFERITVPGRRAGDLELSSISAGAGHYAHTCALASDGAVYCWNSLSDSTAERVAGVPAFSQIVTGRGHACGRTAAGAAYCWGENLDGQLGDGTRTTRAAPAPVADGHVFQHLSAGDLHTCGVTAAGNAYCWGSNSHGQLGDGTTERRRTTPAHVAASVPLARIAGGGQHSCALTAAGAAYCWGLGTRGALGNGEYRSSAVPVAVATSLRFVLLAAGGMDEDVFPGHVCALTAAGAAYCWGDGFWLATGTGYMPYAVAPVAVVGGRAFAR